MSHQSTISATNGVPSNTVTANGLVTGDSRGVSITPLVGSGGNSSVSVSATSNCSATTSAITVTASSGTYSATFSNLYIHVPGVLTIYAQTIISGTITPPTSAPTHVTLSATGTETQSTTSITATTWGGTTGGTLLVSGTPFTTWVTNGYSWSGKTRGTSYTFKGKRVLNGVDSTYASSSITVPYLATSTAGTISAGDTTPSYTGSTSTVTLNIGNKAAGHDYYVDGVAIGTATSVSKTLPAAGGSTATYTLTVVRPTTYGGNGSSVSDGSVTVTRDIGTPTGVSFGTAPTTEAQNIGVSVSAVGGSGGTPQVQSSTGSGQIVANGFTYNRNRGFTGVWRATRDGGTTWSGYTSYTYPYLPPAASGALTAATIAYTGSATSYTIGFSTAVPSTHDYRINSGTVNSASVTVPATAGNHAFSLQTRRKVASGGDGSTWSSSFGSVNITRSVSAPTHVTCVPGSHNAATTTVTATTWGGITSGTLYVSDDGGNTWQANGYPFPNKNRNASYTFKGKRVLNGVDSTYASTTLLVPYLATSTAGTISASPTSPAYDGSTSTITVSIGNKATGHDYYVDGSGIGSATSISRTLASAAGSQATYVLTVVRPTTYGGNGSVVSDGSVTVTRQADSGSAPVLSSVTNNNESQPIPTATVNLSSSGSGGTLAYAQTSSNSAPSSGWQPGSTFSHARPTTKYYWARQSASLVSSSLSMTANYLTGDTSVSATSSTISSSATSASTTISNGTSGETYAVRLNNGSTNIVTRVGNGSLTIPSASLPTGTNTTTYEIFVQRPTSTGGDGSTYTATNDTFTVTRQAANNPNPNAFTFSDVSAATEGTVITSNAFTLAGMDVASTVTSLNNCSYRIGSGSWQTSTGTAVPANSQITIRTTSSSTYGATVTAHVTVGTTQSTTWSVTTRSNPASVDYGLQVMNANGTNEIFGYNVSTSHIVAHGSISIPHSQSRTISNVEGLLVGNANTVGISVSATVPLFGIYLTHSRGNGQFTISNSSTMFTVVARYMVFRN
jgi:hypothetical protein